MNEDLDIPVRTYRAAPDAGSRKMLFVAGGMVAVALVAVGGYALLRHQTPARAIPVITADPRPVRVKPTDPGGLQVAGQGEDILSGGSESADAAVVTPEPETPALGALRARQSDAAAIPPLAAEPAPVQPPSISPLQPAFTAGAKPVGLDVTLGALETEAAARTEQARIFRRAPDLFGGRAIRVETPGAGGKVWQLRAGPFPDIAGATLFCIKVRAKSLPCALASG